ncbi:hypothetical protein EDB84DRAFT_1439532 [Lactarius hengduanensis]|nr:hypothetical protein EDB84DRAFT_1439532 [Lactarius hengduanensis]
MSESGWWGYSDSNDLVVGRMAELMATGGWPGDAGYIDLIPKDVVIAQLSRIEPWATTAARKVSKSPDLCGQVPPMRLPQHIWSGCVWDGCKLPKSVCADIYFSARSTDRVYEKESRDDQVRCLDVRSCVLPCGPQSMMSTAGGSNLQCVMGHVGQGSVRIVRDSRLDSPLRDGYDGNTEWIFCVEKHAVGLVGRTSTWHC